MAPRVRKTKTKAPSRSNYQNIITTDQRNKGLITIRKLAEKLCSERGIEYQKLSITGGNGSGQAAVAVSDPTFIRYSGLWPHLLDFLILIEDFESAILVHQAECPTHPPPVSLASAIIYIRYRVFLPGTEIHIPGTDQPFRYGSQQSKLKAVGGWTGQSTIKLYSSALALLHGFYETTKGSYQEQCMQCKTFSLDDIRKGHACPIHAGLGGPRYYRSGNVSHEPSYCSAQKQLLEYAEGTYVSRHTVAFLPAELRAIRTSLLASNSLKDLMIWTAIILGSRLFLRIDEVLDLRVDSFLPKFFLVKEKRVSALMVRIQGKTDATPQHFLVWDHEECPEFSPVRSLLLFLAISGRKSGYLFPKLDQIKREEATDPYSYNSFLKDLKHLYTKVLKKELVKEDGTKMCAGTHALRKTAYLLVYWAIKQGLLTPRMLLEEYGLPAEDVASILNDARHSGASASQTYLQDAPALFQVERLAAQDGINKSILNKVGCYKAIYVNFPESVLSVADPSGVSTRQNSKSLPDLAYWFVHTLLETPVNAQLGGCISAMCDKALNMDKHSNPDDEAMFARFQQHLPPDAFAELKSWIDSKLLSIVNDVHPNTAAPAYSTNTPPTAIPANITNPPASVPPSPVDSNTKPPPTATTPIDPASWLSKDYQTICRKLPGNRVGKIARARLMVEFCREYEEAEEQALCKIPPKTVRFYGKAAPIAQCVLHCHSGDPVKFVDANPIHTTQNFRNCSKKRKHTSSRAKTRVGPTTKSRGL